MKSSFLNRLLGHAHKIDKQQVTVEVLRNGEFVLEITTYKMDRW